MTSNDTDTVFTPFDEACMARALELAREAEAMEEVPVGAVLARDGVILGEGFNRTIIDKDPTAHAEIIALRAAGVAAGNYRLPGSELYVTLEPCCMCAGAIVHARVSRVVYGAQDPKTGADGGRFQLLQSEKHNHRVTVAAGLAGAESSALLRAFFRSRR